VWQSDPRALELPRRPNAPLAVPIGSPHENSSPSRLAFLQTKPTLDDKQTLKQHETLKPKLAVFSSAMKGGGGKKKGGEKQAAAGGAKGDESHEPALPAKSNLADW
jgi:hypothetical protein